MNGDKLGKMTMRVEKNSSATERTPTISVIVPAWREAGSIGALLTVLLNSRHTLEVIVAFAEPDAAARRMVSEMGARWVEAGEPNRGRQLDLGAALATGDWLLFQHADTAITPGHLDALAAVDDPRVTGGAFYRKFDERHPRLRCLEAVERWHNRTFGALYGDQSLFVRREVFVALGGFRNLPLMEDVDFSLRLRRHGGIRLLDPPLASSPRKHLAQGPWRTTFSNGFLLLLYHLGVHPRRLHAFYYRGGASGAARGIFSSATTSHSSDPAGSPERFSTP